MNELQHLFNCYNIKHKHQFEKKHYISISLLQLIISISLFIIKDVYEQGLII